MYGYRKHFQPQDTRFAGLGLGLFALPFLGGLAGGLLGSAFYPRPFYGYPPIGYPGFGGPGSGFGYAPGLGFGGPGLGFGYAPGLGFGGPGSGFGF